MNMHAPAPALPDQEESPVLSRARIVAAAEDAGSRIAPVWPLKDFVAVNPYLGLAQHRLEDAERMLARAGGGSLFMPHAFYEAALADGRLSKADLDAAMTARGLPARSKPAHVEAGLAGESVEPLRTAVDLACKDGEDWTGFVAESISQFAAAYWDEGQALLPMPWKHLPLFAAWREMASADKTPEFAGLAGFRAHVAGLPDKPVDAMVQCMSAIGLSADTDCAAYFHRLLMTVPGWAAYARYKDWQAALAGEESEVLIAYLAIRLAWDAYFAGRQASLAVAASAAVKDTRTAPSGFDIPEHGLAWQDAYERGYQRQLFQTLFTERNAIPLAPRKRASLFFCIDVRSEVFRRALEAQSPAIETNGFAGFFGVPLAYKRAGWAEADAQCPVLLAPSYVATECETGCAHQGPSATEGRADAGQVLRLWKNFKLSNVSMFPFVETLGFTYAAKLVTDMLGKTRPVPAPGTIGMPLSGQAHLKPVLQAMDSNGGTRDLSPEEKTDLAEKVLKGMSLTGDFAPLVVLTGHGSTSVNNPHAAGLDCGACGGHAGDVNARVTAALLNEPDVRKALLARQIDIPERTHFLAALHNTTTDEVTIFDEELVPDALREELQWLKAKLGAAGETTRQERASRLGLGEGPNFSDLILKRSRDWSQTRPEWGLAGCAAFIAAPRATTRACNLGGRAFLHSYDWRNDRDFAVLELIMTAPMIVASWINLQYYASTVNNETYGSGNKVLHNVVGTLGVLEGNGGDLRTGLPLQSISGADGLQHEPLRLNVFIEAPRAAIADVIARHEMVRNLTDNGWLHLFAIDETGKGAARYLGGGEWSPLMSEM